MKEVQFKGKGEGGELRRMACWGKCGVDGYVAEAVAVASSVGVEGGGGSGGGKGEGVE